MLNIFNTNRFVCIKKQGKFMICNLSQSAFFALKRCGGQQEAKVSSTLPHLAPHLASASLITRHGWLELALVGCHRWREKAHRYGKKCANFFQACTDVCGGGDSRTPAWMVGTGSESIPLAACHTVPEQIVNFGGKTQISLDSSQGLSIDIKFEKLKSRDTVPSTIRPMLLNKMAAFSKLNFYYSKL